MYLYPVKKKKMKGSLNDQRMLSSFYKIDIRLRFKVDTRVEINNSNEFLVNERFEIKNKGFKKKLPSFADLVEYCFKFLFSQV